MAANCATKQKTRSAQALFPKIYSFSDPWIVMTPLLAPSSTNVANVPLEGRYQPIRLRKAADAVHPMVERLTLCLIDFRFHNSPEQRWHRRPDAAQGADQCRQPPL
jgi:hypothetical protein